MALGGGGVLGFSLAHEHGRIPRTASSSVSCFPVSSAESFAPSASSPLCALLFLVLL